MMVFAGFVVGLPVAQKRRQWQLTWVRMVTAYRLQRASRAHVHQHREQQVCVLTVQQLRSHAFSRLQYNHNSCSFTHCRT